MSPKRLATVTIPAARLALQPGRGPMAALHRYAQTFAAARTWLGPQLHGNHNQASLQQQFYAELRERFDLPAQAAVLCLRQAAKLDGTGGADPPIPYDRKLMAVRGIDTVALMTLEGRMTVPFLVADYTAPEPEVGEAALVLEPVPELHLRLTAATPPPELPERVAPPLGRLAGVDGRLADMVTGAWSNGGDGTADPLKALLRVALDGRTDPATDARLHGELDRAEAALAALRDALAGGRGDAADLSANLSADRLVADLSAQVARARREMSALAETPLLDRLRTLLDRARPPRPTDPTPHGPRKTEEDPDGA